jgi:hypothetical protein
MFGTIVLRLHRLQSQPGLEILSIEASVAVPVRELDRHNPGHGCVAASLPVSKGYRLAWLKYNLSLRACRVFFVAFIAGL